MTRKSSRRTFLTVTGATGALALAGCMGNSGGDGTTEGSSGNGGSQDAPEQKAQQDSGGPLSAGGSSTVYPIASKAGSFWTSNPPADDEEYWGPSEFGIDTDKALADYWGGLYGFESGDGQPPFRVAVGLSHSGTGIEKLRNGQLDMANASAPVEAELPDASEEELSKFTDHVVGVDAQPIVVSKQIYDAGVTKLKAETVRKIYRGEIENWSEIDAYSGDDREIQAIGRAEGSGTDTSFRQNMLGDPKAEMPGVDVRKGENQQVSTLVENSNNAVAYMALAFVSDGVPAIALEFDGKTYEPGKNLSDRGYPLSRDLHMYTYEGTSKKEAAFLRMVVSEYGQQKFVETAGYAKLSASRRDEELGKLPSPEN